MLDSIILAVLYLSWCNRRRGVSVSRTATCAAPAASATPSGATAWTDPVSADSLLYNLRHNVGALCDAEQRGQLPASDLDFWLGVKACYRQLERLLCGEPTDAEGLEGDDSGYTPLDLPSAGSTDLSDFWREELKKIRGL